MLLGTDTETDDRPTTRANSPVGRASRTGGTDTGAGSRRPATTTNTGGTGISWSSPKVSGVKFRGGRPRASRPYRRLRWSGHGPVTRTAGWSPRARYRIIRRRTGGANTENTGGCTYSRELKGWFHAFQLTSLIICSSLIFMENRFVVFRVLMLVIKILNTKPTP